MNTTEAAELAGCKRVTIIKHIRLGNLPAWKPGNRDWQLNVGDVEKWMTSRRPAGRPKGKAI